MAQRPGITNKQAHLLAELCHQLGRPYPGNGMRRLEASMLIKTLLAEREQAKEPDKVA